MGLDIAQVLFVSAPLLERALDESRVVTEFYNTDCRACKDPRGIQDKRLYGNV